MYINMFQENNYEQTLFLLNSCLIVKTEQKHEAFCECFFLEQKWFVYPKQQQYSLILYLT